MKLTVEIESTDADAMRNPRALANIALTDIGNRIQEYYADSGTIRDANGNVVGLFTFED